MYKSIQTVKICNTAFQVINCRLIIKNTDSTLSLLALSRLTSFRNKVAKFLKKILGNEIQ